ncbi:hypothetical protein FM120_07820 [Sphingobacterium faecium PCAi_F2.5]|nr:hypothetical protein FM120_07820 [Sphingobacterium faecium PCAi_F2.5]
MILKNVSFAVNEIKAPNMTPINTINPFGLGAHALFST